MLVFEVYGFELFEVWCLPPRLELGVFRWLGTNYPVTHDLFPSGPWTGFYNYSPKDKHRMDLGLTFAAAIRHFHLNATASSGMVAP